jgi:hypothetical protein
MQNNQARDNLNKTIATSKKTIIVLVKMKLKIQMSCNILRKIPTKKLIKLIRSSSKIYLKKIQT